MLQYLYGMEYVPHVASSNETVWNDERDFIRMPTKRRRKRAHKKLNVDANLSPEASSSLDASPSQHGHGRAITHAQMCVMADYYKIQTLKTFARQQLISVMGNIWNTQEFVEVLDLVCCPPLDADTLLRTAIIDSISRHQSLLDNPEIEVILKQKPDILYNMLQRLRRPGSQLYEWNF
jgi:hypothetical protein